MTLETTPLLEVGDEVADAGAAADIVERVWSFLKLDHSFLPSATEAFLAELAVDEEDAESHGQGQEESEGDAESSQGLETHSAFPRRLAVGFADEVGKMTAWPCGVFEVNPALKPACHLDWVSCTIPWDVCGRADCETQTE